MAQPRTQTWPPLLVLAMGLGTGVWLCSQVAVTWPMLTVSLLALLAGGAVLAWAGGLLDRVTGRRPRFGLVIIAVFVVGGALGLLRARTMAHSSPLLQQATKFNLLASKKLVPRGAVTRAVVVGDTISKNGIGTTSLKVLDYVVNTKGKIETKLAVSPLSEATIQLKWRLKEHNIPFALGDTLVLKADVRPIVLGQSPVGDHYLRYLMGQGHLGTAWLKSIINWQPYQPQPDRFLLKWSVYQLRRLFVANIHAALQDVRTRGIVMGLALGMRQSMMDEDVQAFALSGTSHVLAVSGMHMMVLYGLLQSLLTILKLGYRERKWAIGICIAILWAYALLSGMAPAAIRAATMTTFMLAGNWWQREAPLLNSVAAASMLLLWLEPTMLFQVSFQLSVAGCVGIGLWSQLWQSYWAPKHWLAKLIWELSCVTVAATVTTLPITIYYFQQVPLLWIPANWITGIISGPLTILSIMVAIVGQVPFIGWVLTLVIQVLAAVMFAAVHLMGQRHLVLEVAALPSWFIAILFAGLFFWWQWLRMRWLWGLGALATVVTLAPMMYSIVVSKQQAHGLYIWREGAQTLALDVRSDTAYWLAATPTGYTTRQVDRWTNHKPQRVVLSSDWAMPWAHDDSLWWIVANRPKASDFNERNLRGQGVLVLGKGLWYAERTFVADHWFLYGKRRTVNPGGLRTVPLDWNGNGYYHCP